MKIWKRIASLVLALTLVAALGMTALADENDQTTPEPTSAYSITVENKNKNVSISGKTYSAYKLFDVSYNLTNSSYVYTVAENFKSFTYNGKSGADLVAYLGTQTNGSNEMNAFAEAALKYATEQEIEASGTVKIAAGKENGTINLTEPGYYLVAGTASAEPGGTPEVTAACSLTTAAPKAEVHPKVDAPHVDKKIVEGSEKVSATSASIGDKIPYEVTANIPDMTGYEAYTFTFNDTMSNGLTFNNDVVIELDFENEADKTLVKDTDYTVTSTTSENGETTITINLINFIQYKGKGGTVKVTYSATVNEDADLSDTGNPNKVTLNFSNNPNSTGAGDGGSTATTPEVKTVVYVTGLKLIKTDDKEENPVKLAGAKFEISGVSEKIVMINSAIYQQDADGTWARLKSNGAYEIYTEANKEKYDTDASGVLKFKKIETVTKDTVKTNINTIGYTDENGVLTFEGLGAGRYTITELKAPDGYNLLTESITIEIKWEKESETSDKMVLRAYEVKKGSNGTEELVKLTKESDTHLWSFTVVNRSGAQLPSTGGVGTTMFYAIGSLLVIGAVVLLITKKRLSREY